MITNPARLRANKDPILADLDAKYKGVRMPNLGLSASDASDLISYLTTRTAQINELRAQPEEQHLHQSADGTGHQHN
ncbi:hypothetical protein BLJAPNOD_06539 [Ensifer sp. M14]|nr:hypothetical protein [Ensifer sp. M14]RDL46345.1 hypothetical protein BLJAPNOD_06539 [Ensifer sp. M14]